MHAGTVRRLFADREYGFISSPVDRRDVYFHATALENADIKNLKVGDNVSFELKRASPNEKRDDPPPKAFIVRLL